MEEIKSHTLPPKNTYLLSDPFPMEVITLGETRYKILNLLYKGGNPHSISKEIKKSVPTTREHLFALRKKGLVSKAPEGQEDYGYAWNITEKGKHLIEKTVGFPLVSRHKGQTKVKKVRGHAFIWKIKPNKTFDWKKMLEDLKIPYEKKGIAGTPRIILNKKKVWLGKQFISIFEPKWNSFFNKDPTKSRNDAVYEMTQDMESLKKLFNIEFKYKFTCTRQHYGFVDNSEAKFFIKKKQKILIKNEKGYWFTIDFSQNKYKEAETIHEKDALIDGTGYQKLMNSHERTRFRVTPDFILERMNQTDESINSLIQLQKDVPKNMGLLAKQIESHLALIQEYRKENVSWKKAKIKEIKKDLKYGKQTTLD